MRSLLLFAILVLTASVASAEPAVLKLPTGRGAAKNIVGENTYLLVLNQLAVIGSYEERISIAPRREGAYLTQTNFEMKVGPMHMSLKDGAVLRGDGAIQSIDSVEVESSPQFNGEDRITIRNLAFDAGRWSLDKLNWRGQSTTREYIGGEGHWGELSSLLLLARRLSRSDPGVLTVSELTEKGDSTFRSERITVRVNEPENYEYIGEQVEAIRIEFDRRNQSMDVLVERTGRVLAVEHAPSGGASMHLIHCRDESCERLKNPPLTGPLVVLRTLLEVRAGQRDPDAVDGIVDWDSLALDSGLSSSALSEEQRQEAMTRRVLGREPLPPEMVYPMLAMFDVKVESDRAAVYDRQRGKRVYRLLLIDGVWRLIALS